MAAQVPNERERLARSLMELRLCDAPRLDRICYTRLDPNFGARFCVDWTPFTYTDRSNNVFVRDEAGLRDVTWPAFLSCMSEIGIPANDIFIRVPKVLERGQGVITSSAFYDAISLIAQHIMESDMKDDVERTRSPLVITVGTRAEIEVGRNCSWDMFNDRGHHRVAIDPMKAPVETFFSAPPHVGETGRGAGVPDGADDDDDTDEHTLLRDSNINRLLIDSPLNRDLEWARRARDFFLLKGDMGSLPTKRLVGTNVDLYLYQLCDIVKILYTCFDSDKYHGVVNASKVGLGKTFESIGSACCIVLAKGSAEYCRTEQGRHAWDTTENKCPRGNPFGIDCYCNPGGLTRKIADRAKDEPQLVAAPAHIVRQWVHSLGKFLLPQVILEPEPGAATRQCWSTIPLLCAATITNSDFRGETLHPEATHQVAPGGLRSRLFMPDIVPRCTLDTHARIIREYEARCAASDKKQPPPPPYEWDLMRVSDSVQGYGFRLDETTCREGREAKVPIEVVVQERGRRGSSGYQRDRTVHMDVGRSRLLVVLSIPLLGGVHFPNHFAKKMAVSQHGRQSDRLVVVTACLRPSMVFVDEFTDAKGAATNTMVRVREMTSGHPELGAPAGVVFLSGTPMPNGPGDIIGPFRALRKNPSAELDDITKLELAYKTLTKVLRGENAPTGPDQVANLKADYNRIMPELIGPFIINRFYGQPFLHGNRLTDRRPYKRSSIPIFIELTDKDNELLRHDRDALAELWRTERARAKSDTQAMAKVGRSNAFYKLMRYEVIPSLLQVAEIRDMYAEASREPVTGEKNRPFASPVGRRATLGRNIERLGCDMLYMAERLVVYYSRARRDWPKGRHGLLLAQSPDVAFVVREWLHSRLRNDPVEVTYISTDEKPADRPAIIERLAQKARGSSSSRQVVVSTYDLFAKGIDGLQTFASYLIALGDARTSAEHEQAVGRIHRSGFVGSYVDVVNLHLAKGGEGSRTLGYRMFLKNTTNYQFQGADFARR